MFLYNIREYAGNQFIVSFGSSELNLKSAFLTSSRKFFSLKFLKFLQLIFLGYNQQNCDLRNALISLSKSLIPASVTLVFWKQLSLFVKIKSIVDLCALAKHVGEVIRFVRLNKSQNSSNLSNSSPLLVASSQVLKSQ